MVFKTLHYTVKTTISHKNHSNILEHITENILDIHVFCDTPYLIFTSKTLTTLIQINSLINKGSLQIINNPPDQIYSTENCVYIYILYLYYI